MASASTSSSDDAATSIRPPVSKWHEELPRDARRARRTRMICAWVGLALLTTGLAWAATWLRPPRSACLVLVGAGYEDNLAFPHNYYGWKSLERLAAVSRESSSLSFWGRSLLSLKHDPVSLRTDTRWDQGLESIEERAVVLVMAAHGGADNTGAYLLPQDATTLPGAPNRLQLAHVLNRLAELPAEKHKVLVLDVTSMRVSWPLGMLENAFVRELRRLERQIQSIPNCVVLCASDENQRSWVSEDYRRTAYLHFLVEGLRGAANDINQDGRLSVWEVHRYARDSVWNWVARNRSAQQTPILLPSGDEGVRRAKGIDLCIHRGETSDPLPPETPLPTDQLRELWRGYQALAQSVPAPATYTPQLWRRYQLATLRCEQLLCAGEINDAARLRNLIHDLTIEIQRNREIKLSSVPNTLGMPYVAGLTALGPLAGRDVLQDLWSADPQKYAGIWSAAKAKAAQPQLLQLDLFRQLVLRAAEDPANNLALAARLFQVVHDPLHCGPAETHLMVMLDRHLPAWARRPEANDLIALALQTRLLAEQAAAAATDSGYSYSEEVYPWIEPQIEAADRERRLGEDLLFADASQRSEAQTRLQNARQGYQMALHSAERVREALALRDETFAQLPFYSQWLASHVSDNLIRPGDETLVAGLQSLWKEAHQLARELKQPNAQWIGAARPATLHNPTPRSLVDQTRVARQSYQFLESRIMQRWEALNGIELAEVCPDTACALAVPFDDFELRLKLWNHMRRVSRRFAMDRVSPTAGAMRESIAATRAAKGAKSSPHSQFPQGPVSKASSAAPASNAATNDHSTNALAGQPLEAEPLASVTSFAMDSADMSSLSSEEISIQTKSAARWQGQVALAVLGETWFNACPGNNLETFAQVQHRLNVFSVERDWWLSLLAAGQQIGLRWNGIPGEIHRLVTDSARQDEPAARPLLERAALLARQIDGGGLLAIGDEPTGVYRRLKLGNFLVAAANRVYLEHWYATDPNDEPYYAAAGLVYLNDAERLFANSPAIAPLRAALTTPAPLVILAPQTLEITSEPRFQARYELRLPEVPADSLGYPVCWFETEGTLALAQPEPTQRVVQQPRKGESPAAITVVVNNPTLLAAETNPTSEPETPCKLTMRSFYRGQEVNFATRVLLNELPEVVRVQLPTAATANVAVRADAELQADYGSGSGAVAIVLDCSGSMGPKTGEAYLPTTKFVEATTALQRVMRNLPPGTRVSVWIFGQALGAAKSTPYAEDTIRQVLPPTTWNPQDGKQLADLMAKVSYPAVEPWNESPIVRAMLSAKNDLLKVTGFKTLLVITDGMDNRFAEDSQANPNKQDIPAALIGAFQNTGISINIVGFKVVGGEQAEAKRQFSAVERIFPPGRFYQVDQAEALASALDAAMEQRLRYWIEDFQDQRLPTIPADGLDVGQSGAGDHWLPKGLQAGNYQLAAQGNQPVRVPVAFDPGDLLLLRLGQEAGRLGFHRLLFSQTDYDWKPWRENNGWRMAMLQNQQLPNDAAQMLISLEQQPADNESYLRLPKPREFWLEVQPREDKKCRATRWGYSSAYPAPTWSVDVLGWPRDASRATPLRPLLNVWWNPDLPAPDAACLLRNRDFSSLEELRGKQIQTLSAELTLEDVAVETHVVEVSPGVREARSCLAVRMTLPPDSPYWARPMGISVMGAEHRYYTRMSKYTGLFWPVTVEEAAQALRGVGLVSLNEFKSEAERRGYSLSMNALPAPSPDDSRPRPPLGK